MATDELALRYNAKEYISIDSSGLQIYGQSGNTIAQYGEYIILGDRRNTIHVEIDDKRLGFYKPYNYDNAPTEESQKKTREEARISYLESNKLYIPYSVVLNELAVGTHNTSDAQYIHSNDAQVDSEKTYYTRSNSNIYTAISKESEGYKDKIPYAEGWYELDTSDLWAWKVTNDDHLRLVWKGGIV